MRLAAFGKLCASFDTTYGTRGEAGLATDQVHCFAMTTTEYVCCRHVVTAYWQENMTPTMALQLTHTKAAEIEDYLRKLSDINGRLAACLSVANDTRSPMLTRHRDILHDYTQVCCICQDCCKACGHDVGFSVAGSCRVAVVFAEQ